MESSILGIITGLLLSSLYGIAVWLQWQSMKANTILPKGRLTGNHGGTLSLILKGVCIIILVVLFRSLNWWIALSILIMWFVGGWIATLIERKLYASDSNMHLIVYVAEQYTKDMDTESVAELMSKVAPKWWIKLMPHHWQSKLRSRLKKILLPTEHRETEDT